MLLAAGCSQAVNEPAVTEDKTAPAEDAVTAVSISTSSDESVSVEKPVATGSIITPSEGSVILPPVRIADDEFRPSLAKQYTFETAFYEAEAVARIKVGNWLSEDDESFSTHFEAFTLECFKGDIPETFILTQEGNSSGTVKGYPLFTYGNELLVFLNKWTNENNEDIYWIIGAFTTVLDVSYDNDGNRYYTDCRGILGATMDISSNYIDQNDILSEVYASAVNSDPFVANIADEQSFYSYIFSEDDVNILTDKYKIS